MSRTDLLNKYLEYLLLKNYSKATQKSYLFSINAFFDFCQKNRDKYSNITEFGRAYLVHRFNKGKSWKTVNIDYSSIRNLCIYVLGLEWDYKLIPRPKGRKRLPTILSSRQIEQMINLTTNFKHKTILVLFYTSGIRITEFINLTISDLLLDRFQLKISQGKGGKDRIINIPEITVEFVKAYILKYNPEIYLFEGLSLRTNYRYSSSSIRNVIRQASYRANVPFKVTTHSLRYAYATHHIENGTDLVTLQSQLGHSNIQTTIKYVKLCQTENRHLNHPVTNLHIEMPQPIT